MYISIHGITESTGYPFSRIIHDKSQCNLFSQHITLFIFLYTLRFLNLSTNKAMKSYWKIALLYDKAYLALIAK